MDPFTPTTHQITDNNPGITSSGLLWTIRAANSAVDADFDEGSARYRMSNVPMQDYGTLVNALFGGGVGVPGPSVPSTVSFDVRWSGVVRTEAVRDPAVGFTGTYKQTGAHLDWSMHKAGFRFQSDPTGQATIPDQPLLGHERNGVFFR